MGRFGRFFEKMPLIYKILDYLIDAGRLSQYNQINQHIQYFNWPCPFCGGFMEILGNVSP